MAFGAPLGLLGGATIGVLSGGSSALKSGLRGTPAMDAVLTRYGTLGAAGGLLAGIAVGYLVGHVQDEGWTIPGQ